MMFDELKKYKQNGHFFFRKGDRLSVVSKDVPELPGVYYFIGMSKGKVDLIYIGKSGTITQDGRFKNQLLKGRLNNKQEGIKRQEFLDQRMHQENIDTLDIYWFVTMDKTNYDLPGYVEGILIQRFYDTYGRLPQWNKEY